MSGGGTGLALVGAYLLAGELAAAGWDPAAGFAAYEERMRPFVEANQEIGRLHVHSRGIPDPHAHENTQPGAEPDMEALMELVESWAVATPPAGCASPGEPHRCHHRRAGGCGCGRRSGDGITMPQCLH